MPILDVEVVRTSAQDCIAPELVKQLAHLAGEIFGTPAGRTWVKVHHIDKDLYWENDVAEREGVDPVFVTVLKAQMPEPATLRVECEQLSRGIAEALGRLQQHVHILYLPEAAGRIAFGGELLETDT